MSHSDKRAVHTDALETLGFKIDLDREKRDAIHLAVEPVKAAHYLRPGDHVGRYADGTYGHVEFSKRLGIADPFIDGSIAPGDGFWLVVYPRQITSLRHVWTHPNFDAVVDIPETAPAQVVSSLVNPADPIGEDLTAENILHEESLRSAVRIIDSIKKQEAQRWIREYAEGLGLTYDDLMEAAGYWLSHEEYLNRGSLLEGECTSDEFWEKYDIVKDSPNSDAYRGNFFTCSC